MIVSTPIATGANSDDGRGVLALVTSEDDDDVVLAMFSADFDHEHEDPPFSMVLTDEELWMLAPRWFASLKIASRRPDATLKWRSARLAKDRGNTTAVPLKVPCTG